MIVYLLYCCDRYDTWSVEGVYSTKEKAFEEGKRYVKRHIEENVEYYDYEDIEELWRYYEKHKEAYEICYISEEEVK